MSNNLKKIEKDLRAFAKRCKDIKYTKALLFIFLMTGALSFTATSTATTAESIEGARKEIKTSITDMKKLFKNAKRENKKLMKQSNLELIQLMEQGDQAVKLPWSSWQFGATYTYSNWQSSYKGYGDKKAKEVLKRNIFGDSLGRFVENSALGAGSYGTTDLALVSEPPAEVEVSAGIRPKDVNKQAPTFTPAAPLGALPPFEPKIIQPPVAPVVNSPDPVVVSPLSFPSSGANPSVAYYWWNGNDGDVSQVSLEKGTFYKKTGVNIKVKDYLAKAAPQGGTTYSAAATGAAAMTPASPTAGAGAIAAPGTVPAGQYKLADGTYNNTNSFFLTLLNTPYSYFGSDVKVSVSGDNSTVINLEQEGHVTATLDDFQTAGYIDATEKTRLQGYRDLLINSTVYTSPTTTAPSKTPTLYFNNKGTVEIGGKESVFLLGTTHTNGDKRVNLIENSGKIVAMNDTSTSENQYVFYHSPDTSQQTSTVYVNKGTIDIYSKKSGAILYSSPNLLQTDVASINQGDINLYGEESLGVVINNEANLRAGSNFVLETPLSQYGDYSIGVYIKNDHVNETTNKSKNIVRTVIGKANNKNRYDYVNDTGVTTKLDISGNKTGLSEDFVDSAKGLLIDTTPTTETELYVPQIELERYSRKSLGIYTMNGKLKVLQETGKTNELKISGGEGNIGIYADGGDIDYTGNITMGGSALPDNQTDANKSGGNKAGKGNIGIFSTNAKTINVNGDFKTYNSNGSTIDGLGVYANAASKVNLKKNTEIKLEAGETGENTGIFATGAGTVVSVGADQTTPATFTTGKDATKRSSITIDGKDKKLGTALYAQNGGVINANGANLTNGLKIKVTNGSVAIASEGTNSKVNAKFSDIDYSGEGYALYTNNSGTIDVSSSKISLRGNATGFERDVSVGTSPITLTGASITAYSNDVTIMNLRNVPSLSLTTLNSSLSTYTGGVTHSAGTDSVTGEVYNKYKIAAVDGLPAYDINANLDKSLAVDDANASLNDYVFTRRLSVQRAKVNLKTGFNVKAILSNADLRQIGEKTVVGLSMNSSKYATSNNETQINLEANTSVTADRTDAGNGAVGLFINYGKVNTDASSTINVEKEANTVNAGGVGIYSVNGSDVTAEGKINVSGKDSIGILGVAYRTDSNGNNVVDEFGTGALGQGKVNILNKGEINSDGEGGTGIFAKNNKASTTFTNATAVNDTTGKITLTGNKAVGMSAEKASITNKGTININGQESTGLFGKAASYLENSGTINLVSSVSEDKPNIGMFTEDQDTKIHNSKDIIGGNNTYGIYGKTVELSGNAKIKVGDNSVGIFSNGSYAPGLLASTVYIPSGTTIEVGNNAGVGVFTTGVNQIITGDGDMKIGDSSYGFVIRGTGTQLSTNTTNGVTLGNDAVYIYSADTTGTIENRTRLTSTGSKNYGIYSAGSVTNLADINFGSGVGNVGIYSIGGGNAVNGTPTIRPTITVSGTDITNITNKLYGIGMAAGYVDDNGVVRQTGTITNYGDIKVEKDNGIGMYATGSGSRAINYGNIELDGKNATGMYLDNNAVGENYGVIRTKANSTKTGMIGVVLLNGSIIKNYNQIIVEGSDNIGIYAAKTDDSNIQGNAATASDGAIAIQKKQQSNTGKILAGIEIIAPGNGTATIKRNGTVITPIDVDTTIASATAPKVRVGTTEIDLKGANLDTGTSMAGATSIGMYVDTSGINYTNPIKGLQNLTNLKKVNLIFGTEASKYTDSKNIKIGTNILKPYNDVITSLSTGGGKKFGMASASLTWIATGTQNTDDTFNAVYLIKVPYTAFAKEQDTYNFLDGLEQRYGVEGIGSREKELFNKLNEIGKGEPALFAQAVDQMKGHQYANVQQRTYGTGRLIDKEITHLSKEWDTKSRQSNKIKSFGMRDEYKTDTAGIIDYASKAYGFAYVHENETVKLGHSSGWYAGAVHNRFKFKDIGGSKENQTMLKLGVFKTMSPAKDHNGSLQWTISGEGYVSRNDMHRKYLVVDEIFNAKSDYTTYGVAVKNELGYNIRTSERTSIRPYGGLKLEYGRFSNIKEKSGEMRLDVKGNDYYSVKPEVGVEFNYRQPMAVKTTFVTSLGLGYENELGQVGNVKNKARVSYTEANRFTIRGEKDDRKGSIKADLNIGVENQRFGVTVNAGYDTKGKNVRGGIGFRVIY